MWWSSRGLAIAALVVLAGCGFRPLYGQRAAGGSAATDMAMVAIAPIPDRLGQILHNDLRDRLNPRGQPSIPAYRLEIRLERVREGLAIRRDEEVTRANLKLTANFHLKNLRDGGIALKGSTRSVASFNLVRSDFANLIAERDAERRAARELSDGITTRLAIFFDRQRGT